MVLSPGTPSLSNSPDIAWVKLLGRRKPGTPSRSKRVEDALASSPEQEGRYSRRSQVAWFTPVKSLLLAEKCNALWRLYLTGGDVFMVIGETINDQTVGKRVAWKEGAQYHTRRTVKHLHRNTMTYGVSCMLVDYLYKTNRSLWINRVEYTLENFDSFNILSQGGFELQYMIPKDLIKL